MHKLKKIWTDFSNKKYRHEYLSAWLGDFLASQIYYLRTQEQWSQAKLAAKSGILQPTLSNLEKSCENVTLATLKKLAAAFDVALVVKFVPFSQFANETLNVTLGEAIVSFTKDTIEARSAIEAGVVSPSGTVYASRRPSNQSIIQISAFNGEQNDQYILN